MSQNQHWRGRTSASLWCGWKKVLKSSAIRGLIAIFGAGNGPFAAVLNALVLCAKSRFKALLGAFFEQKFL
jgi:hypothetical protein